ncbi:MAG TPA: glycerophosphodiester phosphodiesterase [Candidatus Scatomorpha pullistercoris]|uniref:Glycerophosphodiester phosphodiesterase n=1 Tax=Candidatus Scatomorpha pullistercoris TaxID=2840929 RepID=A0A9D1K8D2_9FIRM|nr:glycerophosphodiester phosphodiesterase [Candidatus Scatomorpha pullistercoris]
MKNDTKALKVLLYTAGGAAALAGICAYMVAPGRRDREQRAPFMGRNYAHRGLHRIDKSVPENSIPAFEAAARIGYGVELDVHLTQDGEVVVFHDDDLVRLCGAEGKVEDKTLSELRQYKLCGTQYGIPTLKEVLEAINGRCPMIVELKKGGKRRELCRKTYDLLKGYDGRWCVESFDPRIVFWFRIHAPQALRGQLSTRMSELRKSTGPVQAFILSRLFLNFLTRPHFIAYEIGRKPLTVKLCELMGAMKVAWTSREWKTEEKNDAVIFQFYRPRVKYK